MSRQHRKRSSLPDYNSPSDKPPDYSNSADEADDDTDDAANDFFVPPLLPPPPRRPRRFPTHKRHKSASPDHFLDSLLERSVHALEMSNALLQSSMSTQSSLSGVLASDSIAERSLESRARGLSSRIKGNGDVYDHWVDDLDQIRRGVEGLFGSEEQDKPMTYSSDANISSSLPTCGLRGHVRHQRRRPSLDLRQAASSDLPGLHLATVDRDHLVSPPPRALTQFVASTADPDSFILPSTLGLRSSTSSYFSNPSDSRNPDSPLLTPYPNLHSSISLPVVTDRTSDPSTPAYNMLSSFVARPPSSGSSTPALSTHSPRSSISSRRRRRGSTSTTNTEGRKSRSRSNATFTPERKDFGLPSRALRSRSSSLPRPGPLPCPPIEENSSDEGCRAKLTVQSLRKILDDQPPPAPGKKPSLNGRLRPPAFLPRSPPPPPSFGTSTATASISRLYTKATHSSSTRPPSPPRSSAMKHASSSSASQSPSPSPTTMKFPELLGAGVARALGSTTSSSGRSTPKRISFAELPESYASSRPAGSSSKFSEKKGKARKKRKGVNEAVLGGGGGEGGGTWWTAWLVGAAGAGGGGVRSAPNALRQEERVEERLGRGWGPRVGFGSGLDDWAV